MACAPSTDAAIMLSGYSRPEWGEANTSGAATPVGRRSS